MIQYIWQELMQTALVSALLNQIHIYKYMMHSIKSTYTVNLVKGSSAVYFAFDDVK